MRPFPALLLLAGCAAAPEPVSEAPPKAAGQTFAYGEDPAQSLDLYPVAGKGPLIAFVHGGAWQGGSRHEYDAVCQRLQAQGVAAATLDYRLSPAVRHPAHAEDAARALTWLRERTGRPIVAVGHSAGGHILATIAADAKLSALARVSRLVGLEGIYDVPRLAQRWPAYPDWFLKKAFGPETGWAAASPARIKPATKAPWLLVHSKGDELVDQGQTDTLAAHLEGFGVPVQTLTPEGKTHDGVVRALADEGDPVMAAILAFAGVKARH